MKIFRKSRDADGKFALTTLQNPNFDSGLCLEQLQTVVARAEARVASEDPDATPPPADQIAVSAPVTETAHVPPPAKPQPKKAKPSKAARTRQAKPLPRRRTVAAYLPKRELTSLERHSRKCAICKHRDRQSIEEDFVNWYKPDNIAADYHLEDYRCLYRRAHATGLLERRRMNLRFAAKTLVEESTCVAASADTVLRAIRMCTRIDDRGEWHEPPSHVIVSSGGRLAPESQQSYLHPAPGLSAREAVNGLLQTPDAVEILPALGAANPADPEISNRQFARLENESK